MSNLEIARGRSTVLNLTNQSGSTRAPGDAVAISTANDESFVTSTASNYSSTQLGIVDEAIAVGSNGRVVVAGYARQVNVAAAVSRGEFLYQSTTAAKVAGSAIAPPLTGAFGQFLKGGTGTTPSATIYDTQTSGQSSLAVGSNSTDVAGVTAMGATAKYADAAHWHRGIEKVTSSSSNTLQRPTLNIRSGANVGVTATDTDGDGVFDTVTISATAGAGGGGLSHSTVGTTSIGGSFRSTTGTTYLKKVTLSTAAMVVGIGVGVKGNNANPGGVSVAIFSDSAGAPVNVIAVGAGGGYDQTNANANFDAQLNATARTVTFPIGVWLTAADYWLAAVFGNGVSGAIQIAYSAGTGSDKTQAVGGRPCDVSIVATSNTTDDHSIYADLLT